MSSSRAYDRANRLILALGLLGAPAFAAEAEPSPPVDQAPLVEVPGPDTEPIAGEVITVVGEQEVARRRGLLNAEIKRLGYRAGVKKEDYTLYRPQIPWKPSVVVYDEAFVIVKRSPVRFEPPIGDKGALRYLACIPPFTPLCVRIGGQLVSASRLDAQKAKVVYEIDAELTDWREARIGLAMAHRIGEELPDRIEQTWKDGSPLEEGDRPAPTWEERRAVLLDFWADRACTPEGDQVAALTATFFREVVMGSEHPASPEELAAANQRAACGRSLDQTATQP